MNAGERRDERWVLPEIGRRRFLIGAAAVAAAVTAGCASDGGDEGAGGGATTTSAVETVDAVSAKRPAGLDGPVFTLGVASGDPTASAVILWTRLAPDATADDGLGGMPADDVEVAWDLALDEEFDTLIRSATVVAKAEHAHAIHVDATGLEAGSTYWYRFRLGNEASTVGQTRTLPGKDADAFSLAVVNCQMMESGYYAAYRHLQDEDVDVVVHLGDYIYEYPGGLGAIDHGKRRSEPGRVLATLADYRIRYASYKLDEDLAGAHARHPFVATWDDHEVANNYMGDTRPDEPTVEEARALKAAAYQAWWEHLPVRLDPPDGPALAVYRALDVGTLARLVVLDERQDAAVPPCREDVALPDLDYGNCAAVEGEDRTRLGPAQEQWLAKQLETSTATWNLIGNPVVLAGVDGGTDESAFYLDTWDGFPQARRRLIAQLAQVDNPIVLTGDYHAGMTLEVRAEPFDQSSKLVAPEFMSPPISSTLFPADVSKRTPQLLEQLNHHGYLTVDVAPEELKVRFRTLADVTDPKSDIDTASTWKVAAGNPEPKRV